MPKKLERHYLLFEDIRVTLRLDNMKSEDVMASFDENIKLKRTLYWCRAVAHYALPSGIYARQYHQLMNSLTDREREEIMKRVDYYCRFEPQTLDQSAATRIGDFKFPFFAKHRHSAYFFDLYNNICCFDKDMRFSYEFGDVTQETPVPAFVKSRPIVAENALSVVCKLDSLRHFRFVKNDKPFDQKIDMLMSRNKARQPHRKRFLEMYHNHPRCNIGKINIEENEPHPEWVKPRLSLQEQLEYKFISCIEGNDVATNLKWVMSSNSIAVMPRPKYETWFMEGTLIPGEHYIEIKPDYSDLIEKMDYYISHPDECQHIIERAHQYIQQFQDKRLETATQFAVLESYFNKTGQM